METIRALTLGDLPPVGNAIDFGSRNTTSTLPQFRGYHASFVDSGTSALALALVSAKIKNKNIINPEVIVPGYGCPDLVAAAIYAQVKVVVVDISQNDPAYQQSSLLNAINQNTIAIIAVNFLGVAENIDELLLLKQTFPQINIIEDNAQWFPRENEFSLCKGDYVIFSFGRGKPVSLLGGGMLLAKEAALPQAILPSAKSPISKLSMQIKYFAYNSLLHPFLYQFLSRNPLLHLGVTEYHPHSSICEIDDYRKSLLSCNIERYQARKRIEKFYDDLLLNGELKNNFSALTKDRRRTLLRYPLLCESVEVKNKLFTKLKELGLGASELYRQALPNVAGVNSLCCVSGELSNAQSFAERFITLPLHEGVKEKHLLAIKAVFGECELGQE